MVSEDGSENETFPFILGKSVFGWRRIYFRRNDSYHHLRPQLKKMNLKIIKVELKFIRDATYENPIYISK